MSEARAFLEGLLGRLAAKEEGTRAIPEPSPRHERRRLCVGMATYDDPEGVWFTIQAIRLYHPEMADKLSFLIVDNHPEGQAAANLKSLERAVPYLRYLPFAGYRGTAVRDLVFAEANADIVCCIDSHVLLVPGALAALERYFTANPDSRDLLQGPLVGDDLSVCATHFKPTWGAGMYGQWDVDRPRAGSDDELFEIAMHGLGVFACRAEAWPGLNPRFRGFGGEEGYLHEKIRRGGGRVLCHPGMGWLHRFLRPLGPPYGVMWGDLLRNYLIGWDELGWDTAPVAEHFAEQFEAMGCRAEFDQLLARTAREARNPFLFFDGIFCLNLDEDTERWARARARHEQLDIAWRVERFSAVATPDNHHRGNAMSFRAIIAEADRRGYEHVLLLEDDAVFIDDTASVLEAVTAELGEIEWDLCFLGACVWAQRFPSLGASNVLQECGPVTCTHAVAVHRRAYGRILGDIPAGPEEFDRWLGEWLACDQYLSRKIAAGALRAVITSPRVASQPPLLVYPDADLALAGRYTI